jgi:hypothetical protein
MLSKDAALKAVDKAHTSYVSIFRTLKKGCGTQKLALKSGAFFQFGEDELGDFAQGLENTFAFDGDRFNDRLAFQPQAFAKSVVSHHIREIAFVELQHVGDAAEFEPVLLEVFFQVLERFEVGVEALFLRVSDKNHAIRALQNKFAACFVEDLAWNCVEVQTSFEASNAAEIEREKIEKKRAVGFRSQRNHLAFHARPCVVVNPLEIGGFPA